MKTRQEKIALLLAFERGTASEAEAEAARRLLASDSEAAELLQVIRQLDSEKSGAHGDRLREAARTMSAQIIADFIARRQADDPRMGVLVFDSSVLPLPEGVRPAAVDTRQVRYRFEEAEVSLALYPISPSAYELVGQVAGRSSEEALTVVLRKGKRRYRTEADTHHLFRFDDVAAGRYRLSVFTGDREIAFVMIDV
ncbi:hypothetical protein GF420_09860 [candidate division GN15 bacterium]|nr:hypothetical protein [candidate division GN15 bacterium]